MAGDRAVGTFLSTPLDAGVDENKLAFLPPCLSLSLSLPLVSFLMVNISSGKELALSGFFVCPF